jgi:beta-galactosidase
MLIRHQELHIGSCYYPEQFDPSQWRRDADSMEEAGFNVVRLGEMTWSGLEVNMDDFRFEWMDDVLGIFYEKGIGVVLGTPTATLPPWLVEADPKIMPVNDRGVRASYGSWGSACLSSRLLLARTSILVEALGERFGQHPAVIGWQIDNELMANTCFCERCKESFYRWIEVNYVTI